MKTPSQYLFGLVFIGLLMNIARNFIYDVPFTPIRNGFSILIVSAMFGIVIAFWELVSLAIQIRKGRDKPSANPKSGLD
jgi:RsiW-degrading membrane proteinase PrsW (M82 family)